MASSLEQLLIGDWNVYMHQTFHAHAMRQHGRPMGMRKPSPENLDMMATMVQWCRENHVEPRIWLFNLFARTGWRFPPRWDAGYLMSPTGLAKFRKNAKRRNTAFFRRRMGASAVAEDGTDYDPNRDLTPSVEGLKARYQESGQAARCLEEMLLRTFGYHPASKVCVVCPLRQECALQLEGVAPFPILALRAGRITSEEAERMANAPSP